MNPFNTIVGTISFDDTGNQLGLWLRRAFFAACYNTTFIANTMFAVGSTTPYLVHAGLTGSLTPMLTGKVVVAVLLSAYFYTLIYIVNDFIDRRKDERMAIPKQTARHVLGRRYLWWLGMRVRGGFGCGPRPLATACGGVGGLRRGLDVAVGGAFKCPAAQSLHHLHRTLGQILLTTSSCCMWQTAGLGPERCWPGRSSPTRSVSRSITHSKAICGNGSNCRWHGAGACTRRIGRWQQRRSWAWRAAGRLRPRPCRKWGSTKQFILVSSS